MSDFPVIVLDDYGDPVTIGVEPDGTVSLEIPSGSTPMYYGPEQYEDFSQAWVAAGHAQDEAGASDG